MTMNAVDVLKRYRLDNIKSVHTVIRDIGDRIDNAKDPHVISNQIIVSLGGKPLENPIEAGMLARCLVEQAYHMRDNYDKDTAVVAAVEKTYRILKKMPGLYLSQLAGNTKTVSESTKKANDKRQTALRIYMENVGKKNKEIAAVLMTEMGLTESNANYFVQQFKKASK